MENYKFAGVNLFSFAQTKQQEKAKEKQNQYTQPYLNGVFHQNGYKVATDGLVLLAVKDTYSEELEGKVIDKDGNIIADNYPNWRSVVAKSNNMALVNLHVNEFKDWLKQVRVKWNNPKGFSPYWLVSLNGVFFYAERYDKLIKGAKALGTEVVYIKKNNNTATVKIVTDKGYCCAMPVAIMSDYQKNVEDEVLLLK